MSKPLSLGRKPVALPGSRIRRQPVRPVTKAVAPPSPERETFFAMVGIVLIAAALVALVLGALAAIRQHSEAADVPAFGQCYNHPGADCVVDGDTIYLGGERLELAVDAPEIREAQCPNERRRGIEAATRLAALLNKGPVTVTATETGPGGEVLSHVEVNGADVGGAMFSAGLAQQFRSDTNSWC